MVTHRLCPVRAAFRLLRLEPDCAHALDELLDLALRLGELLLAEMGEPQSLLGKGDSIFQPELTGLQAAGYLFETR